MTWRLLSIAMVAPLLPALGPATALRQSPASTISTSTARAAAPIVVAELFTSEGCSSCPPADGVLSALADGTLAPGIDVIALSEHVDYWDQLGWRDPFSSAAFSDRQSLYDARVFHADSVYTPQLVIDGQAALVGSDRGAVRLAVQRASRAPAIAMAVTARRTPDGRALHAAFAFTLPPGLTLHDKPDLVVLVTEDHLVSQVRNGENSGRRLAHTGVVRHIAVVDTLTLPVTAVARETVVPWKADWNAPNVSVVGLLQEHQNRRIVAAGRARLGG